MNYQQFLIFRDLELKNNPDLIDLGNTNLYKYFNFDNTVKDIKGHVNGNVHRCHLVEDWLSYYNVDQLHKKNIGVSNGVRNTLQLLIENYKNKHWLIPSDVYPFYQLNINNNVSKVSEYQTLAFSEKFKDLPQADIMLLNYPLKPFGHKIMEHEKDNIFKWIKNDSSRILIVDAVYAKKEDIPYLIDLYNQGRVYLLFSLSKGWCLPNIFGVNFVPKEDADARRMFKKIERNEANLKLAYSALHEPDFLAREMIIEKKINENRASLNVLGKFDSGSYLYYSENSAVDHLRNGYLVIPAGVFGGKIGSVISLLK